MGPLSDSAVIDAPAESTPELEAPDTGIETGEPENQPTPEGEAPPDPNAPPKVERAVADGPDGKPRLTEAARAALDELRKTNLPLAKAIRDAIFEADRFKREVPGGLQEIQQLRQTVEDLGGEQGIDGMRRTLDGFQQFDKDFTAGDPKAIEFMTSDPEGQHAFMKLAPTAFNKFAELNPEGYGAYVSQVFVSDMQAAGIPLVLDRLQDFLPADQPRAQALMKQLVDYVNRLGDMAKKPMVPAKGPEGDGKSKELETQVEQFTRKEWTTESAQEQNRIYGTELTKLLNGRKVTDGQREDILLRVQTKLGIRIKEQESKLNQYFAVKDKAGFLRFANSFSQKHIPELLREAVDRYVPSKPGPKPNGAVQLGPVKPPVNGKPANGAVFVSKQPSADQIDWGNPATSIRNGIAVLKDGKRVSWKR